MLKKFSIIVFILISISLIFMSTQKKLVPQIDMLTISGETISTEDLIGNVYLVNFWATDCPGCIEEMPGLIDTFNKYKSNNLVRYKIKENNIIRKFKKNWIYR